MRKKKENIGQPISGQPENILEQHVSEDSEIPQPFSPIINPEVMDIHAHHLHKAPGNGIWHYAFEFLMLFLAVTLGFFVENQREKYIEHLRENEFARLLLDDLKVDTSVLQRTLNEKVWIEPKFDSAMKTLERNTIRENNEFLYYVSHYLTFNDAFTSQDATYKQLSSGNFRYIDNTRLYKQIAGYYNLYSRYQMYDIYGEIKDSNWENIEVKLFNAKDFHSLTWGNTYFDLTRPTGKLTPLHEDEQSLKQLYRRFAIAKQSAFSTQIYLKWLKRGATNLINELEKEYPEIH